MATVELAQVRELAFGAGGKADIETSPLAKFSSIGP